MNGPHIITGAEALGIRSYKVTTELLDDDNQVDCQEVFTVRTKMKTDDLRLLPFIFTAAITKLKPEIGFAVRVVGFEETTEWA